MTTTEPLFSMENELESWADTLLGLPAKVVAAIGSGDAVTAVRALIAGGRRTENWLTDVVFHSRHPELHGRAIRPGERKLADEWHRILREIVRPALAAMAAPAPPVPPATPTRTVTDWQQRALQAAGIDAVKWLPGKGFTDNKATVVKVYEYDAGLFARDPNLLWAGMAKLAGAAVYGALLDAQTLLDAGRWTANPYYPSPLGFASGYVFSLQVQLLSGQKAIFDDLAWQHQAFVDAGVSEVTALLPPARADAWRDIASGAADRVRRGNKALLRHEQEVIIAPYYAAIRAFKDFDQIPAQMSGQAKSPIPGGNPFREVVPGGDLTVFADRWKWIETDMLPAYEALTPEYRRTLVATPLAQLATRQWPPP